MIAGGLIGIALLAWMRPGTTVDVAPRPPIAVDVPAVELPPSAPAPVQRNLRVVRPTSAARSPLDLPEEGVPTDTGAVPDRALLLIDVVDEEGRPSEGGFPAPMACPGFEKGPKPGSYFADPGVCTLQARRHDGLLMARGQVVATELSPGQVAYLTLELGNARTGGVGVRFQPAADGMRVVAVVDGSAAWDAGLEPGDLIVGVEGVAVQNLSSETFIQAMTGAEGTDVEFRVQFTTDTGVADETVRVTRRFLDG